MSDDYDDDAYDILDAVIADMRNAVVAATMAVDYLDKADASIRTAAASLDRALAVPLEPVGDGGPYDAMDYTTTAAIHAVVRGTLGIIDDSAAGAAAVRNALTAAANSIDAAETRNPPYTAYSLLRALDVIDAMANNRHARESASTARDAFVFARDAVRAAPERPPPQQAADHRGGDAANPSTQRAPMDRDGGAEARKSAGGPASMKPPPAGGGSDGRDNEGDHASMEPRSGSEESLHGGTCAD